MTDGILNFYPKIIQLQKRDLFQISSVCVCHSFASNGAKNYRGRFDGFQDIVGRRCSCNQ